MEEEDFVLSVKNWDKKTGKSKYSMPIININTRPDVTSYAFANFSGKYIYIHQPKISYNKIETQKQLKKAILYARII